MSFVIGTALRRVIVAAVAITALLLVGCGGGGSGSSGSSSSAEPKRGGELRVSLGSEVHTLEPASAISWEINMVYQLFDTLFKANEKEEAEPWLVTKYEKSADLREWTFDLRSGVKFSNGKPMTSADVVFSIEAAQKSEVLGNLYEDIAEVRAEGPLTVVIETKTPAPALPETLSLFIASIVPKDYAGMTQEEFGQDPIGTGPFKLQAWNHGTSITMVRNPLYWQPNRPYLDQLEFVSVSDDNSRISQLKGGLLNATQNPPWPQTAALENTPGIEVVSKENVWSGSLLLNAKVPLFKDARAREAVSIALNRDDITQAAMNGQGQPARSFLPLFLKYAKDIESPTPDAEKANKLLDEAVKATGESPELELTYEAGESYMVNSSQVIQQNLEDAGFKVTQRPLDLAAYEEFVYSGNYEMSMVRIFPTVRDPIEFIGFYSISDGIFTYGDNTEIDELAAQAGHEIDPQARRDLYYEIQDLIAKENYVVTMNDLPTVYAIDDSLAGFKVRGTGYVSFADVGFTE